jgi:hypothetical protein
MTDRRPQKPRNRFKLVLVPAVSAALLAFGCDGSRTSTRVCVDQQGRRLPDDQCRDNRYRSSFHHWYYVTGGGAMPPFGATVRGGSSSSGSSSPASGFSSVSRGGFGSSAHASGHVGG